LEFALAQTPNSGSLNNAHGRLDLDIGGPEERVAWVSAARRAGFYLYGMTQALLLADQD
jgi:hypothetical protein